MGGSKSKPVVQESARAVLSRREVAPVINEVNAAAAAAASTKVAAAAAAINPSTSPTTPSQQPLTSAPPPDLKNNTSTPSSSHGDLLHKDILEKISKVTMKSTTVKEEATIPVKAPISAASIRAKRDAVDDLDTVPPGRLTQLQIHELFKYARNSQADLPTKAKELAVKYQLDEELIVRLLKVSRLPTFKRSEEDPGVTYAK